jgi:serine/threonine-protein kinase
VVPASDQYSLGIVAYEMLTGRVPFRGASIMDIMRGHFVEAPPPIQELRRDCPAGLAQVVMRMLAKEPEQRYESLDEVVTAIDLAPLASDDPTRTQMVELARSGARSRPSMPSGRSPLPKPRNTVNALNNARTPAQGKPISRRSSTGPTPRGRDWNPVLLAVGALGCLGLGWGLSFLLMRPAARAEPSVSSNPVATLALDTPATRSVPPSPSLTPPAESIIPLSRPVDPARNVVPTREPASTSPKPTPTRQPVTRRPAREPEEYERVPVAPLRPTAPPPERPRPQPQPQVVVPQVAYLVISTRTPNATLYINGQSRDLGSRADTIEVTPGRVALRIMAPGCDPDDKTVNVAAGATMPIGRFNAKCSTN